MILNFDFIVAGSITGLVVGITGVGGGAIMTPILLMVFGVPPTTAIATDLWFAALTKLVGARIHCRATEVDWQIVKRLWLGSIPVSCIVVLFVSLGIKFEKLNWLTQAIGWTILLTAIGLLLAPHLKTVALNKRLGSEAKFKKHQPKLTVAAGSALGLLVALTSVGAGALGSVLLLYLYPLRMTPHRLIATDLVHAVPLAMVAGTGYLLAGMVDGEMLFSLLSGSLPAVVLGSLATQKMNGRWLQLILGFVLIGSAVKVITY